MTDLGLSLLSRRLVRRGNILASLQQAPALFGRQVFALGEECVQVPPLRYDRPRVPAD